MGDKMKTVSREAFVDFLVQHSDSEEPQQLVLEILDQMGWGDKQEFVRDDMPLILHRLAVHADGLMRQANAELQAKLTEQATVVEATVRPADGEATT